MSRYADAARHHRLDPDSPSGGYFRHAVYNHWDPYEDVPQADLEADREKLIGSGFTEAEFEEMRTSLALFGAGEEAVTEDLAPLMMVLEDVDDQMFVSSQIYEEAKHTQFFDRYWREVIDPVAEAKDWEVTEPTDQRYFNEDYEALFDGTDAAMRRLLEDDTPTNRVVAYCHYHLVVESVLAQTGYYGLQSSFSQTGSDEVSYRDDDEFDYDRLDGLIEGITRIRSDEGRHVGFGMRKVQKHIREDAVDPATVQETLQDLMGHVAGILQLSSGEATNPVPLMEYSRDKLTRRIEIITSEDAEVPPVEELVAIETPDDTSAAAGD